MFNTKMFKTSEAGITAMDLWLNSLRKTGYGVKIVSQCVEPETSERLGFIFITVNTWKLQDPNVLPARSTIDQIPEEPSINYPEDEVPNLD